MWVGGKTDVWNCIAFGRLLGQGKVKMLHAKTKQSVDYCYYHTPWQIQWKTCMQKNGLLQNQTVPSLSLRDLHRLWRRATTQLMDYILAQPQCFSSSVSVKSWKTNKQLCLFKLLQEASRTLVVSLKEHKKYIASWQNVTKNITNLSWHTSVSVVFSPKGYRGLSQTAQASLPPPNKTRTHKHHWQGYTASLYQKWLCTFKHLCCEKWLLSWNVCERWILNPPIKSLLDTFW